MTSRKQLIASSAMALSLAFLALPIAAQETSESAALLGRIVLGYTEDGTPIYAGENSSTLEGEAISGYGGYTSLDEILRQTPGVTTLMNEGQPGIAVAVRGLQGSRVATTLEGVPQNYRFTAHNTADGFAYVDPLMLSSISVNRGASLTEGGLAGAVDFRLLNAQDIVAAGEGKGGMVRLRYGDNGQGAQGVLAAGMIEGPIDLAVALSRRDLDAYKNGAGDEVDSSAQKGGSTMLRGGWQVNEALKLTFLGTRYSTDYDSKYKRSFVPGMPPVTLAHYQHEIENTLFTFGFAYNDGGFWNLSGNLYSGTTEGRQRGIPVRPGGSPGSADGRIMETETIGLNAQNVSEGSFGNWTLTSTNGFDISRDSLGGQNDASGSVIGVNPTRGGADRNVIFSENVFANGPFEVMAGFRYTEYDLDTTVEGEHHAVSHSSFDPKLTLAYRFNDSLQAYATAYRSSRSPTAQETFLGGGDPSVHGFSYEGNLDLVPEVSQGFELGLNIAQTGVLQSNDSLSARVNYFNLDVENYIFAGTHPTSNRMQFQNADDKVKSEGLELEVTYQADAFSAVLAWAHTDAKYEGGRLQPKNAISATLAGHFLSGALTLGTTITHNSNGPASIAFESSANRDKYTTIDLFANYDVSENFRIDAKIANITDELYTPWAASENIGAGRSAYIGGEFRF